MSHYRFHVFAHEDESNKPVVDEPAIEIACDASLDEGAIIRTVAPHDSIGASRTQYFLGLDGYEVDVLLRGMDLVLTGQEYDHEDLTWLRERIARIREYISGTAEETDEKTTINRSVLLACLEPLRLAEIYALKDSHPDLLPEDFKPHKWDGYEEEYVETAHSAYRGLLDAMIAESESDTKTHLTGLRARL